MALEEPTVGMLATVAGISLIVTIVTEIILRAWSPTVAMKDRFGPLLALLVGILFAVAGSLVNGSPDLVTAVVLGVVSAGTGMGVHDTVTSVPKNF